MYEKFTDRARKVMQFANEDAVKHCIGETAPQHILLGIIREGTGGAIAVLQKFGCDLAALVGSIEAMASARIVQGSGGAGPLRLTPHSEKVLRFAAEEAALLGSDTVDTEHLLIGLLRETEGWVSTVLRKAVKEKCNSPEEAREAVRSLRQASVDSDAVVVNMPLPPRIMVQGLNAGTYLLSLEKGAKYEMNELFLRRAKELAHQRPIIAMMVMFDPEERT